MIDLERADTVLDALSFIRHTSEGRFYISLLHSVRDNDERFEAALKQTEAFLAKGGAGLNG